MSQIVCCDAELGQGSWKELKYDPNIYRGAACSWQEHHMANFDLNWCTIVLKWLGSWKKATEYTFCNNITNTRGTELKFWYKVETYIGHLCCEFQWAATYTVELTINLKWN